MNRWTDKEHLLIPEMIEIYKEPLWKIDKNSLWNALMYKKGSCMSRRKNRRIWGAFSRHSGETGTKRFRSGIRMTQDRMSMLTHRYKEFFTPSCGLTNPLPHSSEQDPMPVQLR